MIHSCAFFFFDLLMKAMLSFLFHASCIALFTATLMYEGRLCHQPLTPFRKCFVTSASTHVCIHSSHRIFIDELLLSSIYPVSSSDPNLHISLQQPRKNMHVFLLNWTWLHTFSRSATLAETLSWHTLYTLY